MKYIGNAFSIGMLDMPTATLSVMRVDEIAAQDFALDAQSCVGHADTALLFSELLGKPIEMRRVSTSLQSGDELLVGQYNGPRLPEGAVTLPEGAKIRWFLLTVE